MPGPPSPLSLANSNNRRPLHLRGKNSGSAHGKAIYQLHICWFHYLKPAGDFTIQSLPKILLKMYIMVKQCTSS